MSSAHQPPPSSSNFQSILNAALKEYKKKTGKELTTHPLFAELQNCRSPDSILAVLQEQARIFDGSRGGNERLMMWLTPTVNILYSFSATLGEGVGLVFSPAKVIFAGIGVLLMAAKGVGSSQDALLSLFERIENFFKRLQAYTEVPPTAAMTHIIVKIMAEVLSILAIATKRLNRN
ncbi:hypothetical protein B0F90DRAFT_1205660 [Multifurca ochricompacta]|uniref:Fungal STAND N-terminal Goodbye domain-containing protein n=1 Tax=Multifurca ochricompacta TaxID=376703 RepID=A0AAD4LYJ5_9AGAM|nr:hypothetical protein B0F90DRAFT_1205660 [Multifurca ochricompacta]